MSQLIRRILIVDDTRESRLRYAHLVLAGDRTGIADRAGPILPQVSLANGREEAVTALTAGRQAGQPFHVLVTDLFMPDVAAGLSLIRELKGLGFDPKDLEVLLLSTHRDAQRYEAEIGEAAAAWGIGRAGLRCVFREKPRGDTQASENQPEDVAAQDDSEFLSSLWTGIWEKIDTSFRSELLAHERYTPEQPDAEPRFSANARTQTMVAQLLQAGASSKASILIEGESGTGKTHLARLIHERSVRSPGPFLPLNCAAIPSELFESEMYGHERGAFTGAVAKKDGLVKKAFRGTLFLDEVSELELRHQAKLLGFLNDWQYTPVGGTRRETADVRLIVASNVSLKGAVRTKAFRDDLYYRLNVLNVILPPLRERTEDIVWLAQRCWRISEIQGAEARVEEWSPEALEFLCQQPWRGNARELQDFVTRLKLMGLSGNIVSRADLERRMDDAGNELVADPDLDTFTQRAQHHTFLRAVARLPVTITPPGPTEVVEAVMNSPDALLFPFSGAQRRAKVQAALYDHRKACGVCRRLIPTQ